MEQLGQTHQDLVVDPRIKVFQRRHWCLNENQLLIRCRNNFGLSVLRDILGREIYKENLFEAALVKYNGPDWTGYEVIIIDDDVFRFLTKDQVFEILEQVEMLTEMHFRRKAVAAQYLLEECKKKRRGEVQPFRFQKQY